ncbi:two-component system sensor histidine kinase CreC [Leeia aquatica]|uniref:histidine kinase n=1 Tax=Leeia aquatica TaxID=2725557 RepID=A0A847S4Z3_9NEIS|nr:two-component system sensor histidine kinase CreC [Leeia aquatica]NLR76821.1 two-component system sensor histidine kinase CreC [Leeia aquatica]
MRVSLRILLSYVLIVAVGAWFVMNTFRDEVKPGISQSMEDGLNDTAHLLAHMAAPELRKQTLHDGNFAAALHEMRQWKPQAVIWGVRKQQIDYRVYITDTRGIVMFDSDNKDVGKDFSRWNDVYLTLRGKYGARSTRSNPDDESSSVMHVAAPIRDAQGLLGVLTVAKPISTVQPFVDKSQQSVVRGGLWLLLLSLAIGILFSLWITGSLNQLVQYATLVSRGERATPPALGSSELASLSQALATMREKLEGKQYVEHYVHTLTHEMKSPLAAIRGAAELLHEDLPPAERQRFAQHVSEQTLRLQDLIDKMLGQASVESLQHLQRVEAIDLPALLAELAESRSPRLQQRQLLLVLPDTPALKLEGDRFLLGQALGNLLDNAIDFSPQGGRIELGWQAQGSQLQLTLRDHGSGIPDYALPRLFERFYSLPRPDSGKKSTGLGLPFVREVIDLHHGQVDLHNHPQGGVEVVVSLPLRQGS